MKKNLKYEKGEINGEIKNQNKKEEKVGAKKIEEVNFTAPKIDNICVGERER